MHVHVIARVRVRAQTLTHAYVRQFISVTIIEHTPSALTLNPMVFRPGVYGGAAVVMTGLLVCMDGLIKQHPNSKSEK